MAYDISRAALEIYSAHRDEVADRLSDADIRELHKASQIVVCGWIEGPNTIGAIFVKGGFRDRARSGVQTPPERLPVVIHADSAADADRIRNLVSDLPQ